MIYAFREGSPLATATLMESIFSLRHSVFVETLNWRALRQSDSLERDQFDHTEAIHLVYLKHGRALAYSRLLPTSGPHLPSDIYPELMKGHPSPRGPDIWEWTRLCARCDPDTGAATPIRALMVAVAEISVTLRISRLIAQSGPGWVARLNRLGWDAKALTAPTLYDGSPVVPLEARILRSTTSVSRRVLAVGGDILDVCGLLALGMPAVA